MRAARAETGRGWFQPAGTGFLRQRARGVGNPIRVSALDRGLGDSQSWAGSSPRTASGGGGRARSVGTCRAPWARGPLAGPRPQVTPTRFSLPEPESERMLVLQGEEKRLLPPGSPSRGLVRPPAHIARGARAPFVRGGTSGALRAGAPRYRPAARDPGVPRPGEVRLKSCIPLAEPRCSSKCPVRLINGA